MKAPPKPDDEESRVQSLEALGILDTAPEPRFDRLTRLASRLFDVPTALVSLVDRDRQWFKSKVGLDEDQTDRDVSFCGHAILEEKPLVVPDALKDERFSDNPLVVGEPHVRFYAGRPLRAPNGHRIGTLCLLDRSPRTFSEADAEALDDLATIAERELALAALATGDELTGLLNRRGFRVHADRTLALCVRRELPMSLVFMDLDGFKSINDRCGHAEGDRILKRFAKVIERNCRDSDVRARLGGDEFVVLLAGSDAASARRFVARISRRLDDDVARSRLPADFGVSVGIVEFDRKAHATASQLLWAGDRLMYAAKEGSASSESLGTVRVVSTATRSIDRARSPREPPG